MMRTTVYENQSHDLFIINEFSRNYYVCSIINSDRSEQESNVIHSKFNVYALVSLYTHNGYTCIFDSGKTLIPEYGMAIQYFNKDDFLKIQRLFSKVAVGENLEHLLEYKYRQSDVDKGYNWFEIDEDGDVFMSLHEKFISQSIKKVKLEDLED